MKYLYWIGGLWLLSTVALFAIFAIVVRIDPGHCY